MTNILLTNFATSWTAKFGIKGIKKSFQSLIEKRKIGAFLHIKYHSNFAVVRFKQFKFVYIIFYGGHVNCTGLANSEQICFAIKLFKVLFPIRIINLRIQAIAATTDTKCIFTPKQLYLLKRRKRSNDRMLIVREFFTGILIKFAFGGTAQLFYSGKVNILGAKTLKHLILMCMSVYTLIQDVK